MWCNFPGPRFVEYPGPISLVSITSGSERNQDWLRSDVVSARPREQERLRFPYKRRTSLAKQEGAA